MAEHCKNKPGYSGFFYLTNGEKMDRKKMVLDAWESMDTGREGYGYQYNEPHKILEFKKGKVIAIYRNNFKIYSDIIPIELAMFSFTDPRPLEAPPKGTVVMVKEHGKTKLYFSMGRVYDENLAMCPYLEGLYDSSVISSVMYSKNWIVIGKVPEDLT